jgi:hypothetical protein
VELQLPTQIYMGQMRLLAMKTSSYLNLRMMALVMVWRMMKLSLYLIPETLVVSRSAADQTLIVVLLTISNLKWKRMKLAMLWMMSLMRKS